MKPTFWVTVTPARENAGTYHVDSDVASIPDDAQWLSVYQTDSKQQALGFFDSIISSLSKCKPKNQEWLDNFNQCLSVGDLAQVVLYQVDQKKLTVTRVADSVLTVGGSVRWNR